MRIGLGISVPKFLPATNIPSWVPSNFQSADLYVKTNQPVGDGTYGMAWLRKRGLVVPMRSIMTRTGTGGTAFDASGNVVSQFGPNLLTTAWTMTVASGGGTATNSPAGTLNLQGDGTNASTADQSFTTIIGRVYNLVFTVSGGSEAYAFSATQGGTPTTSGTGVSGANYLQFTATATTTWLRFSRVSTGLNSVSSIYLQDATSLRATNAGLTTEEARTNQITQSAAPTVANGWTLENGVTTTQSGLYYLVDDGTTAGVVHRVITPSTASFTSGTTYVAYALVKYVNAQFLQLAMSTTSFGANGFANFDLVNGTVTLTGTGATGAIRSFGGGLYLVSFSIAAATTAATQGAFLTIVPTGTSARGPATNGAHNQVLVANFDVNTGAFPTTPILTTSAAVTRAQDFISFSDVSWLSQGAGTLYANFSYEGYTASANEAVITLSDGTLTNRISFFVGNTTGYVNAFNTGAGQNTTVDPTGIMTANVTRKVAQAYAAGDFGAAFAGTAVARQVTETVPTISPSSCWASSRWRRPAFGEHHRTRLLLVLAEQRAATGDYAMSLIFLRATSEADLQTRLATMGYWSPPGTDAQGEPTGGYVLAGPWGHLDVVGIHYSKVRDASGNVVYTTDDQGNQVPQTQLEPNTFLANLVTTDPLSPEVTAILDYPKSPSRVFS